MGAYHTYHESMEELERYAAEHPDIARVETIGTTYLGNPIKAIKVSKDVDVEDPEKPEVLYMGQMHAREVISCEAALGVVERLIDGYGIDEYVTDLVDSRQVWVVPIVNPDGALKVQDDLTNKGDTKWRKNLRENTGTGRFSESDGVDLNRNFPVAWDDPESSYNYPSETYHGPAPFSEPETAAIRDLVEQHDFVTAVAVHSYKGLIMYPPGHTSAPVKDTEAMDAIAHNMVDRQPHHKYKVMQSSDIYIAPGTVEDWLYEENGVLPFIFEVYKGGSNFLYPFKQINTFTTFNPPEKDIQYHVDNVVPAALYAAEIADDPHRAVSEREGKPMGPSALARLAYRLMGDADYTG